MADAAGGCNLERLVSMQHRLTRGYTRLLEADRWLSERRPHALRNAAAAVEEERRRMAVELHEGAGQPLSSINAQLDLIEDALPDPPAKVRKAMEQIRELASDALDQVRGVSRRTYAPAWQAQPLVVALRELWENSGIPEKSAGSTLDLPELASEPALEVRNALYRAAQTGISNVIHHSRARHVHVSLRAQDGRLTLVIQDDGCGFDVEQALSRPPGEGGIGLHSTRETAARLGGYSHVESGPQGSTLTVSLPENP